MWYLARGTIVVFDRHFFADYYHYDVSPGRNRTRHSRIHGYVLRRLYPRPDLVICLDAPGDVLYQRKGDASPSWLEERRHQYLQLGAVFPNFAVVNVDKPLDNVTREIAHLITQFVEKRRA
ncbi:MAG: hypothetical protein H0T46_32205 [Deltaproteobacteria bacterium]|nr:hypothetical protein [Deltaproteobacteria bacterium]